MGIKFTGVRKDSQGHITHVRINDGRIIPFAVAQQLAHRGQVDSLSDLHADGRWEIADSAGRSDFREDVNLDILPEIE